MERGEESADGGLVTCHVVVQTRGGDLEIKRDKKSFLTKKVGEIKVKLKLRRFNSKYTNLASECYEDFCLV